VSSLFVFLIIKNKIKFIQKKPQRTKSIQKGEVWQLPFSKRKGPILPMSVKNLGAQLTPIPEINGVKWEEKGREKIRNEEVRIKNEVKNFQESLKIK
jgi:hypothetical protein